MAKAKKVKEKAAEQALEVTPARHLTPFEEMDRLFENFFPRSWLTRFGAEHPAWRDFPMPFEARMPRVDVIERDEDVLVRAEIPGVDKENIDVSLTENSVTIKGSSRKEEKEEGGDYFRREISEGSFTRTLALPGNVDIDSAKATFKDGILEVAIKKVEKTKRHSVKVQ
jgi:HSP20 family protein